MVWASNGVALSTCPTSYVTAQSRAWLEEFFVRRPLSGFDLDRLSARDAEAFLILEQLMQAEENGAYK